MADISQQLQQAYQLIKAKQRDQAVDLLVSVLKSDESNANAWWLLANALRQPDDIREALATVLRLQPGHERARQMLTKLNERFPPPPPAAEPEPDSFYDDPFADAPDPFASAASPFAASAESYSSDSGDPFAAASAAPDPFGDDPFAAAPASPDPFASPAGTGRSTFAASPFEKAKPAPPPQKAKRSGGNDSLLVIAGLGMIVVAVVIVVIALVSLTGGGGGGAASAEAAARDYFQAILNQDIGRLRALTCQQDQAMIDQVEQTLGSSGLGGLGLGDVSFDTSGLTAQVVSQTETTAVVRIGGSISISASGVSMDFNIDELAQGQDTNMPVVLEEGTWRVCSSGSSLPLF